MALDRVLAEESLRQIKNNRPSIEYLESLFSEIVGEKEAAKIAAELVLQKWKADGESANN